MAQGVSGAPAALEVHVTGWRVLATVADGIVLSVAFSVMSMLFGSASTGGGQVGASLNGLAALFFFILFVAYFIILEGYLGQTMGKMLLGIKAVREDNGEVPGLKAATIRTLMRIIDGLFACLVAFIAVLASQKNQRLGDMLVNTLEVRK